MSVLFPLSFSDVDDPCMSAELKVKVRLSLCLINKISRRENALGSGDIPSPFFTSALDGGE
jgi:hypothetical protein